MAGDQARRDVAAAAMTVRIEGLKELRAALKKAGADMESVKDAMGAIGDTVATAARPQAPYESGALAATIRANRAAGRATVMAGSARVPYALPIHWGWPRRGITGRPFVLEAAQATEARWMVDFTDAVQKILDAIQGA